METHLREWSSHVVENPDDLYDLDEYETGESYPAMTGRELLENFIQWEPRYWHSFFFKTGDFDGGQVSRRMFLTWQQIVEFALSTRQSEWQTGLEALGIPRTYIERLLRPLSVYFDAGGAELTCETVCETVLDEIIASVYIAKIYDGEFRRCGNSKCTQPPFPIGPLKKEYCGHKCAHAAGQRARRQEARLAAASVAAAYPPKRKIVPKKTTATTKKAMAAQRKPSSNTPVRKLSDPSTYENR